MTGALSTRRFGSRMAACLMLALLRPGVPSHAAETAEDPATVTDALIPMVVLPVGEFPAEVKVDDRGISWNGVVLARQPVRPVDAIVIDESLNKAIVKRSLLLTWVGKIDRDARGMPVTGGEPTPQIWCRDVVKPNASVDCYEDRDGDGKLDQRARGYLPRLEPLSLNRLGPFEAIDPIAYRRTSPAELPVYEIDYLVCGEPGAQIRFARRIDKVGPMTPSVLGPCDDAASPAGNPAGPEPELLLDQVRIRLRTVDGTRHSRMIEGMAVGTIVGHLRTDQAVSDVAHARRFSEEHEQALAELPDIYVSTQPVIAKDPVKAGDVFFSAQIKHRITGTLRVAATQLKLFKGKPTELVPAGVRLFGVEMRNVAQSANLDANIVWCYPPPVGATDTRAKCIAHDGMDIARVVDAWDRFTVSRIGIGSAQPAVRAPIVDRDDGDFGEPILLDVAVERIAKKRIFVRTRLDRVSEQHKSEHGLSLERANDGNGYLMIAGGVLVLEPLDEQTIRISEKVPVTIHSDVDVRDAVALMRSLR